MKKLIMLALTFSSLATTFAADHAAFIGQWNCSLDGRSVQMNVRANRQGTFAGRIKFPNNHFAPIRETGLGQEDFITSQTAQNVAGFDIEYTRFPDGRAENPAQVRQGIISRAVLLIDNHAGSNNLAGYIGTVERGSTKYLFSCTRLSHGQPRQPNRPPRRF